MDGELLALRDRNLPGNLVRLDLAKVLDDRANVTRLGDLRVERTLSTLPGDLERTALTDVRRGRDSYFIATTLSSDHGGRQDRKHRESLSEHCKVCSWSWGGKRLYLNVFE